MANERNERISHEQNPMTNPSSTNFFRGGGGPSPPPPPPPPPPSSRPHPARTNYQNGTRTMQPAAAAAASFRPTAPPPYYATHSSQMPSRSAMYPYQYPHPQQPPQQPPQQQYQPQPPPQYQQQQQQQQQQASPYPGYNTTTSNPGRMPPYAATASHPYSVGGGIPGVPPPYNQQCGPRPPAPPRDQRSRPAGSNNNRNPTTTHINTLNRDVAEATKQQMRRASTAPMMGGAIPCCREAVPSEIEAGKGGAAKNPTTTAQPSLSAKKSSWQCVPCKLVYETEHAYKQHRKSHVKCTECAFEGSTKVVKAHYASQHGKFRGAGLKTITVEVSDHSAGGRGGGRGGRGGGRKHYKKFKICVGNNPQDIQKWIAERKKHFPRTSTTRSSTTPTSRGGAAAAAAAATTRTPAIAIPTITTTKKITETRKEINTAAPATTGLSMLLAGYGSSSSDDNEDDDEDNTKASVTVVNTTNESNTATTITATTTCPAVTTPIPNDTKRSDANHPNTNPLTSVVDDIQKCEESEHKNQKKEEEEQESVNKEKQVQPHPKRRPCRFYFQNGACRHGDKCTYSHAEADREVFHARNDRHKKRKQHQRENTNTNTNRNHRANKKGKTSSTDSLLRKLLQTDMEREATLTLQLLKYIVDSNFFVETSKDDTTNTKKTNDQNRNR